MRILVSWLRELVPIPVGIDELADALTRHGFEVSAVEPAPEIPGRPTTGPDAVLDLEITTNRPDCLGVIGVAREVSTIFGSSLSWPPLAAASADDAEVPVTIEEAGVAACARYAASVAAVSVVPSPAWMAARLEAAGVRPINAVVDVTNYVMLELGHPMHAFDLDRLAGAELRVRPARPGETVRTLDGVERALGEDMLVIADAARAQALAGVMGGADSEVSSRTARVALESAWFDPISVRRTSRRLQLSTDASYRFERGADIDAPVRAMRRAHACWRRSAWASRAAASSTATPLRARRPPSRCGTRGSAGCSASTSRPPSCPSPWNASASGSSRRRGRLRARRGR